VILISHFSFLQFGETSTGYNYYFIIFCTFKRKISHPTHSHQGISEITHFTSTLEHFFIFSPVNPQLSRSHHSDAVGLWKMVPFRCNKVPFKIP